MTPQNELRERAEKVFDKWYVGSETILLETDKEALRKVIHAELLTLQQKLDALVEKAEGVMNTGEELTNAMAGNGTAGGHDGEREDKAYDAFLSSLRALAAAVEKAKE